MAKKSRKQTKQQKKLAATKRRQERRAQLETTLINIRKQYRETPIYKATHVKDILIPLSEIKLPSSGSKIVSKGEKVGNTQYFHVERMKGQSEKDAYITFLNKNAKRIAGGKITGSRGKYLNDQFNVAEEYVVFDKNGFFKNFKNLENAPITRLRSLVAIAVWTPEQRELVRKSSGAKATATRLKGVDVKATAKKLGVTEAMFKLVMGSSAVLTYFYNNITRLRKLLKQPDLDSEQIKDIMRKLTTLADTQQKAAWTISGNDIKRLSKIINYAGANYDDPAVQAQVSKILDKYVIAA